MADQSVPSIKEGQDNNLNGLELQLRHEEITDVLRAFYHQPFLVLRLTDPVADAVDQLQFCFLILGYLQEINVSDKAMEVVLIDHGMNGL